MKTRALAFVLGPPHPAEKPKPPFKRPGLPSASQKGKSRPQESGLFQHASHGMLGGSRTTTPRGKIGLKTSSPMAELRCFGKTGSGEGVDGGPGRRFFLLRAGPASRENRTGPARRWPKNNFFREEEKKAGPWPGRGDYYARRGGALFGQQRYCRAFQEAGPRRAGGESCRQKEKNSIGEQRVAERRRSSPPVGQEMQKLRQVSPRTPVRGREQFAGGVPGRWGVEGLSPGDGKSWCCLIQEFRAVSAPAELHCPSAFSGRKKIARREKKKKRQKGTARGGPFG